MGTIAHVVGYTVDELAGSELDTDVDTRSHSGRLPFCLDSCFSINGGDNIQALTI